MKEWEEKAKREYDEELNRQTFAYRQWIKENESLSAGDMSLMDHFALLYYEKGIPDYLPDKEFIIFHKEYGKVPGAAIQKMYDVFTSDDDICIIYGDEDVEIAKGDRRNPWFKPDWSPDTYESLPYFGSLVAVRKSYLQDRLKEIPDLYDMDAVLDILVRDTVPYHLDMIVYTGTVDVKDREPKHIVPDFPDDKPVKVTVIIPSKDHPEMLGRCIIGLTSLTDYRDMEILVIDNGSTEENRKQYESLKDIYGFEYYYERMQFNFSRMCNIGALRASGEVLLFLNDDTEVLGRDWLRIMASVAIRPHVGAVGAKLYYPFENDEIPRIQHDGITNTVLGPVHKMGGLRDTGNIYHGQNICDRDVIAVTGACMAVEKKKFNIAGGFFEELVVAYNDVDLCFSLYEKGFLNVIRNDVRLIHHESVSRGSDETNERKKRRMQEWIELYKRHPGMYGKDPFYNRNLVQTRLDVEYNVNNYCDHERNGVVSATEIIPVPAESSTGFIQRKLGCDINIQYYIDSADVHYEFDDNGDYIRQWVIEGWSAPLKQPLWHYERKLILIGEDKEAYLASVFPKYRQDVRAVMKLQEGAELSGFVCRISADDLADGEYRIGLYYLSKKNEKTFVKYTDSFIKISKDNVPVLRKEAES